MNDTLQLLLTRRSVKAIEMIEPGPSPDELDRILEAAARVPDHGKLGPWRFVRFTGDARLAFGQVLVDAWRAAHPEDEDARVELERGRLVRGPVVVAVISSVLPEHKIPEWEQVARRRGVHEHADSGARVGCRPMADGVVRLRRERCSRARSSAQTSVWRASSTWERPCGAEGARPGRIWPNASPIGAPRALRPRSEAGRYREIGECLFLAHDLDGVHAHDCGRLQIDAEVVQEEHAVCRGAEAFQNDFVGPGLRFAYALDARLDHQIEFLHHGCNGVRARAVRRHTRTLAGLHVVREAGAAEVRLALLQRGDHARAHVAREEGEYVATAHVCPCASASARNASSKSSMPIREDSNFAQALLSGFVALMPRMKSVGRPRSLS